MPHSVGGGKDALLTHHLTFLTENLSAHAKNVPERRSIHTTMLRHDVTTAYAAETSAVVLRACHQSLHEISTSCGPIAPESLGDRNPVRGDKIPDKRQTRCVFIYQVLFVWGATCPTGTTVANRRRQASSSAKAAAACFKFALLRVTSNWTSETATRNRPAIASRMTPGSSCCSICSAASQAAGSSCTWTAQAARLREGGCAASCRPRA